MRHRRIIIAALATFYAIALAAAEKPRPDPQEEIRIRIKTIAKMWAMAEPTEGADLAFRNQLIDNLASLGPATTPELILRLDRASEYELPRDIIIAVLGRLRCRTATASLCRIATDPAESEVNIAAATTALRDIGNFEESVRLLLPVLNGDDERMSSLSARALRGIAADVKGAAQLSHSCIDLMPIATDRAILLMIQTLSGIDNRDTDLLLLRCLGDDSPTIRAAAIHSLTGIGISRSSVDVLVLRLADSDEQPEVLKEAAYALGRLKCSEALSALISLLNYGDEDVQKASLWALRSITHREFGKDAAQWQLWLVDQRKFSHSQFEALTAQFYTGSPDLRPVLLEEIAKLPLLRKKASAFALTVLRNSDFRVRAAACNLLAQSGDFEAVPLLVEALLDSRKEVEYSAWRALRVLTGMQLPANFADWNMWLRSRG